MRITANGPQSIGQVARYYHLGNLFLSPVEYQRESAWDLDQKKLLIDTIFIPWRMPCAQGTPSSSAIMVSIRLASCSVNVSKEVACWSIMGGYHRPDLRASVSTVRADCASARLTRAGPSRGA
jgi:hypothetical protein